MELEEFGIFKYLYFKNIILQNNNCLFPLVYYLSLSSSKTIKFQKDFDHLDKVISLNLLIFCYYLLYCFILAVKVRKQAIIVLHIYNLWCVSSVIYSAVGNLKNTNWLNLIYYCKESLSITNVTISILYFMLNEFFEYLLWSIVCDIMFLK
jgi:hypothetical protein